MRRTIGSTTAKVELWLGVIERRKGCAGQPPTAIRETQQHPIQQIRI